MPATIGKHRVDKGITARFGGTHHGDLARQWFTTTSAEVPLKASGPSHSVFAKLEEDAAPRDLTFRYGRLMGGWLKHEFETAPDWLGMLRALQPLPSESVIMGFAVQWPSHGAAFPSGALANTLALEQNSVTFEPRAMAILGRIFDRGHATCEDLADWLESPDEWIAFSRLQRARLLYDAGTEFTLSPEGRALVQQILSESELE